MPLFEISNNSVNKKVNCSKYLFSAQVIDNTYNQHLCENKCLLL